MTEKTTQTSPHWGTWLHHLYLGVASMEKVSIPNMEDSNFAAAATHFASSLQLRESAEARRNLAIIDCAFANFTGAYAHYKKALDIAADPHDADPVGQALLLRNLGAEVAQFLMLAGQTGARGMLDELVHFVAANNSVVVKQLPLGSPARRQDRWRMAEVLAALHANDHERVFLLCDCNIDKQDPSQDRQWPTLGYELHTIMGWYRQAKLEQAQQRAPGGRPLSLRERNAVIRSSPLPRCLRAIGH